jgi:hypothetical protein
MSRPRPPYLQKQTTRHGKVVWYVRRGSGPRVRIHATFGSPAFAAEYQAAGAEMAAAPPKGKVGAGSLEWLIRRYRESSAWASLASATRDQRENILRDVEKQAGDVPFTAITRQKIVEGREKRRRRRIRPTTSSSQCAGFSAGRLMSRSPSSIRPAT